MNELSNSPNKKLTIQPAKKIEDDVYKVPTGIASLTAVEFFRLMMLVMILTAVLVSPFMIFWR